MDEMIQNRLLEAGVDVLGSLNRFAGKSALYERFLNKFPSDSTFEMLEAAVEQQDWEQALRAAHTLKGVAGNLGMSRLYLACSNTVAFLREEHLDGALKSYEELKSAYHEIIGILEPAGSGE